MVNQFLSYEKECHIFWDVYKNGKRFGTEFECSVRISFWSSFAVSFYFRIEKASEHISFSKLPIYLQTAFNHTQSNISNCKWRVRFGILKEHRTERAYLFNGPGNVWMNDD